MLVPSVQAEEANVQWYRNDLQGIPESSIDKTVFYKKGKKEFVLELKWLANTTATAISARDSCKYSHWGMQFPGISTDDI